MKKTTEQKKIERLIEDVATEQAYKIDAYIKLHIKPKPKYLPKFIWQWILKRLLVLHEFI